MYISLIIIIILLAIGLGLLLLETFVIPGFGIVGIIGVLFYVGGIMMAFSSLGAKNGTVVLSISLIITAAAFIGVIKSKMLDRISLKTNISSTVNDGITSSIRIGDKGTTITRLNPIGKARINGETVEAKSDIGFLDENTEIEVISVNPTNVIVKPVL